MYLYFYGNEPLSFKHRGHDKKMSLKKTSRQIELNFLARLIFSH